MSNQNNRLQILHMAQVHRALNPFYLKCFDPLRLLYDPIASVLIKDKSMISIVLYGAPDMT